MAKSEPRTRAAQLQAEASEQTVRRTLYVSMMGNAKRHFAELNTYLARFRDEDQAGQVTLDYAPPLAEIDRNRMVEGIRP